MTRRPSRSVLVTGGSAGIGAALTAEFARHGDRVVVLARRVTRLRRLAHSLRGEGCVCYPIACDLRNDRSLRQAISKGKRLTGNYDIIINNAGVTYFKDAVNTTTKESDEILDVNLRALILVTLNVLPSMVKRKRGLIINILSYAAKTVYTGSSLYSASKAGAEAFMNVVREEVRNKNVKIMNVYPGAVLTPMWMPGHRRKYGDRMMKPGDVAALIYQGSTQPASMMVEELVLRPQGGDLRL